MDGAWLKLLTLPVIAVATLCLFTLTLVVIALGYTDPSSAPGTELRRLTRRLRTAPHPSSASGV